MKWSYYGFWTPPPPPPPPLSLSLSLSLSVYTHTFNCDNTRADFSPPSLEPLYFFAPPKFSCLRLSVSCLSSSLSYTHTLPSLSEEHYSRTACLEWKQSHNQQGGVSPARNGWTCSSVLQPAPGDRLSLRGIEATITLLPSLLSVPSALSIPSIHRIFSVLLFLLLLLLLGEAGVSSPHNIVYQCYPPAASETFLPD